MASPTTTDDKRVEAALAIRCISSNLKVSSNSLDDTIGVFSNPNEFSQARRTRAIRELKQLKEQLIVASNQLAERVKLLDPIPSLNYVYAREKKSLTAVLQDATNKRPSPSSTTPAPKKRKTTSLPTRATAAAIDLPKPKDGKHYSRKELVEIIVAKTKKGTKERIDFVNKIADANLVPCQKRNINKLLQKHEEKGLSLEELNKPWGAKGRNPILDNSDLANITAKLNSEGGRCISKENVEAALVQHQKQELLNRGIQPLNSSSILPSQTTVRNYHSLMAAQPNVSITRTATVKSPTRFTAENSLRSAMSFILTAAASHFVLATTVNPDVLKDLKDEKAISRSSKNRQLTWPRCSNPIMLFNESALQLMSTQAITQLNGLSWKVLTK